MFQTTKQYMVIYGKSLFFQNGHGGILHLHLPSLLSLPWHHVAQLLLGAELIEQRLRQNGRKQLHLGTFGALKTRLSEAMVTQGDVGTWGTIIP